MGVSRNSQNARPSLVHHKNPSFLLRRSPSKSAVTKSEDKRVEFSDEVLEIPFHGEPLTAEEQYHMWYERRDFALFSKDRFLTALQYSTCPNRRKLLGDNSDYSLRGLEELCDDDMRKKILSDRAVLLREISKEQERQREQGCYPDFKRFRDVSAKRSRSAVDRAFAQGRSDAVHGYVAKSKAFQRQARGIVRAISRKVIRP